MGKIRKTEAVSESNPSVQFLRVQSVKVFSKEMEAVDQQDSFYGNLDHEPQAKMVICYSIQVQPHDSDCGHGRDEVFGYFCRKPSKSVRNLAQTTLAAHGLNWASRAPESHFAVICQCSTTFHVDGYLLSYFAYTLKLSRVFSTAVFRTHFPQSTIRKVPADNHEAAGKLHLELKAKLYPCQKHYFDRLGSRILNSFIHEKIELDDTLSWLSSLGGAFSALGDISSSWAEQAGRITIHQLKIALKLGDPLIVSRCHLYASLSLIQRGYYESARKIILKEYKFAKRLPAGTDTRLIRMCQGIWAKLKYTVSVDQLKLTDLICSSKETQQEQEEQRQMNGLQTGMKKMYIIPRRPATVSQDIIYNTVTEPQNSSINCMGSIILNTKF